ncbi:16S rRNA (uracil(1498)-N(3))-methyltransferase [Corynebacterium halotolerans]|uniref:Ribosomal RNA small subunit methyltransferase E n=1 Tax=Corynebacterium halotolerans YIM 70093 = DSM 44683 TaxID=1121362 RepID=M1MZG0_9CORY|nr:16S rRNA (uracil(1498)-N(3))-methyltransferase [Corynebacterium halotolerans]AGF73084.1 16S ribosomal RNA methyltransferase RsmE [Corynebacterium halotolerans YIM 70093 = DSM 44683]
MSLPVFLHDGPFEDTVELGGAEARHAVTVKRVQPGEHLLLVDGRGTWAEVEVTATSGKERLSAEVITHGITPEPTPRVTVVQALPKSERSELAVDLATQAGADAIIPWQSERTIARWTGPKVAKGVAKWEAAALAAAKQSRRTRIPVIGQPVSTNELAGLIAGETALILHEDSATPLREVDLTGVGSLYLIVGPEGGIGEDEVARLREAGARPVRLGPEVLRTASAAMVALSALGVLTSRW